jgi:anti-anti-sigma factor
MPSHWRRIAEVGVVDQLHIGTRREGGRAILSLAGELDMASVEILQRAIEDEDLRGEALIVLDLQQLEFIDSTGLRSILTALERCRERGQKLAVTPGSQQVQRLLRITGVAEHLPTIAAADETVA